MSQVIYKYPLQIAPKDQTLILPILSTFRFAHMQRGELMLWVEHTKPDQNTEVLPRTLLVQPTGVPFPEGYMYLSTVIDGPYLVWHLLEKGAPVPK